MDLQADVREFLARWALAHERRDPDAAADLFLRQPAPLVTFSDGDRAADWLDVRVRLGRDLERAIIERVDVHNVQARELNGDTVMVAFSYDLRVRDVWGSVADAHRHAMFTLVRTKDGLRIAAAHFAAPR
jgi:hypothetical protein